MNSLSSRSDDAVIASLSRLVEEKRKIMILLRGLPGSGKSYLAKRINSHFGGYIASADNYFMRSGEYRFDPDLLEYAHCDCQNKVKDKAREQISPIIVDNTNLESWEMKPYVVTALEFGYVVHLLEPSTEWKNNPRICHRYNRHDIPLEKIIRMKEKFDRNITAEKLIKMCQDQFRILSVHHFQSYLQGLQPNQANGVASSTDSGYIKTKSPIELHDTAPTVRSAIRSFSSTTDWKIPFYPSSDTGSVYSTANSSNSTVVCDSSCQTASSQFTNSSDPLHANDFGETCIHTRDVIVRRVTTLDKSTSSSGNPNSFHSVSSRDEQLQILAEKFPEVELETLIDIIELCNGNIHYAINVLSDASCDSSNSDESMPMIDDLSPDTFPTSAFESHDPLVARMTRSALDDRPFSLEIPASFASELEGEFGALTSQNAYFNRRLSIPKHVARQLYEIWRDQCETPKEESSAAVDALKPPAGEFEEQMQLEEALKQSRAYADTSVNPQLTELYQKYPGCSEEILDQFFFENDRNLEKTIAAVDEQTRLASTSLSADNKWCKVAKKVPVSTNDAEACSTGDYFILDESEFTDIRNTLLDRRKRLLDQKANQKDSKTSQYYSEEINKINREYHELVNAFVLFKGKSFTDTKTLDLHGLRIKEAGQLFKAFVQMKRDEINSKSIPHIDCEIITGWGLHSPNMRGQLANAMLQSAAQLGLTVKSKKKGSFVIRITRTF